jgi:mRNA interferase MazF
MAINRGEIYFVNLNPVKGKEQAGHRPVLILSVDSINRLPLVITVIVGTKGANLTRNYQTNVRVSTEESGLPMETVFLCFQVRSLDAKRFPEQPAGKLSSEGMQRVEDAVRYSLGL